MHVVAGDYGMQLKPRLGDHARPPPPFARASRESRPNTSRPGALVSPFGGFSAPGPPTHPPSRSPTGRMPPRTGPSRGAPTAPPARPR
jgi:hypothetical protein